MKMTAEILLYSLQFASAFFLAAPIMMRAERQNTLSRNPAWVASQPGFLETYGKASPAPAFALGAILLVLLAAAAYIASPLYVFIVHAPVFLAGSLGLMAYCAKVESGLRGRIPRDTVRHADLAPRKLSRFLPAWSFLPLGALAAGVLAVNAFGNMASDRALGNSAFFFLMIGILVFALFKSLNRQSYRTSGETDAQGRAFELRITLAVTSFVAAISLYHALGSLGPRPLLPHPPTMLHAWLEGVPFSWSHYLHSMPYRVLDYSATVFLIAMSLWIANSRFHRKVLSVDFSKSPRPAEV